MSEERTHEDRKDAAQAMLAALGNISPMPSETGWLNLNTADGKRWIVMVISDPTGRKAVWFDEAGLRKHATEALGVADQARAQPAPLTVAQQIPQGIPLPGGFRPPAPGPNGGRP